MKLTRRAFLSGAATAAVVAALAVDAVALAGPFPAWRPSRDELARWRVGYQRRYREMHELLEQVNAVRALPDAQGGTGGWPHVQAVETVSLAETRAWLAEFERFDAKWRVWQTHVAAVAAAQGAGYGCGRDAMSPENCPDMKPDDQGYAFWDGFEVGRGDLEWHARRV